MSEEELLRVLFVGWVCGAVFGIVVGAGIVWSTL